MSEYRVVSPDVLAEFRTRGDEPEFWASLWRDTEYVQFLSRYAQGRLDEFDGIFRKHLPKKGRIVEAGCGRGQYVAALRGLGYDIVGVDFAGDLVNAIKRAKPDMPVEVGDVRVLPYPDSTFAAYISLGVVEHFWDETDKILAEARRVLEPGGKILVSVPYFSPQLRKRARREFAGHLDRPVDGDFYQFYYSREAFVSKLEGLGFEPVEVYCYGALYGAKRSFPRFDRLYNSSFVLRYGLKNLLRLGVPQAIERSFGHMLMIVARKSGSIR